ncbi:MULTISPECIES: carbohydrate ABC transporter permease [Halocynthiibacter]|uniref:Carbohydrate ABC transporter permease n=1 Tax=Halocynthiibacter halioticoli TaxID=2986804 RepID=A0AAE3LU60_9RHOB|nr:MULTISPECIES: carbohydrate ABC transporter permease [Halocynthiibacter]MCV6822945.1 carbohydrate ABC transporter permease [Halocynthiibacter halioticoli]MCW4055946.1 carbohydrate ABC transporter permease [Halocynthiibacter sp. SDUM655004]
MQDTQKSYTTAIILALIALIWVSPFSWLAVNAVNPEADGSLSWPNSVGFQNFAEAMSGQAGGQFMNSLFLSILTSTLTVIIAVFAAYPLSRLKIPGRNAFLWALVLLRMLPATGVIVPIFFTAKSTGMLNLVGVAIAITMLNLPFTLLLLKNFFDTVPVELEEAAYSEGASFFQIMRNVMLPMSRAGIAVVWFFSFTTAWNEFLLPLIFVRKTADFPMSVGLFASFGEHSSVNYGFLASYSILYAVPAVAVYFLLRRNLNTGFAGVGVKG